MQPSLNQTWHHCIDLWTIFEGLSLSHIREDWTETHLSEEADDGSAWRDLFSSDLGAFNICTINGRLIHFTLCQLFFGVGLLFK